MRFVTYLAVVMKRANGTIKQRIFAIRYGHLVSGREDPTANRQRLWAALGGFARWAVRVRRKFPVTPEQLNWIHARLQTSSSLSRGDVAALWGALNTAFFFMLRASEYLIQPGKGWGQGRALQGRNVQLKCKGEVCTNYADAQHADEILLEITGSKTDQYNFGTLRNHYKSGGALCPVRAIVAMWQHFPARFEGGSEADLPLFRYASGAYVSRQDVQSELRLAAGAFGWSSDRMGSHSLRIGGATAMFHIHKDLEAVKRFGRWLSGAFHSYLWESHEQQQGMAKAMAEDKSALVAPTMA